MHDPISDLLTRIRNAGTAGHTEVLVPHSAFKESIAKVLSQEGYLSAVNVEGSEKKSLKIALRYQGKKSVITGLRQVSSPGLRRYVNAREIPRVLGGMGIAVLSTPQGVMTDVQARKNNLGGEVVCFVW
jgi:small subunit ribosomal protein S8